MLNWYALGYKKIGKNVFRSKSDYAEKKIK